MDAFKAFAFGALLALAVGPIALLIVARGVRDGARSAVPSAIGVALADFTYALLAFSLGGVLLPQLHAHEAWWRLGSSLVLVAVGAYLFGSAVRQAGNAAPERPLGRGTMLSDAISIFFLTLANPLTIVLFAAFLAQLDLRGGWLALTYYALLVFLGSLLVQLVWASAGAALGAVLRQPAVVRAVNFVSFAGVVAFGLYGLVEAGARLRL